MKEQRGVLVSMGDVIRFQQPRDPHRAGHSIQHHPEDEPYLTGEVALRTARAPHQPRARASVPVVADVDDGQKEPRRASLHTTARRLDRNPLETRDLSARRLDPGRLLLVTGLALLVMLLGFMALSWLGSW
jgi:hypothetical protein